MQAADSMQEWREAQQQAAATSSAETTISL